MRTILVLGIALLVSAAYAATISPQIGGGIGQFDGGISSQGVAVAPTTGSILLVDGSSLLLQVDGSSGVCLAGGC